MGGMSAIPITKIWEYARFYEMDEDVGYFHFFVDVMRASDTLILKMYDKRKKEKNKKEAKQTTSKEMNRVRKSKG